MKRTTILSVVGAALFISLQPVLAQSSALGQKGNEPQRDECLLVAKLEHADCPCQFHSIAGKIDKLSTEIAKGTRVYSPEELNYLNKELDQFRKMQAYVNRNAPQDEY